MGGKGFRVEQESSGPRRGQIRGVRGKVTYLHAQIRIAHATINGEFFQGVAAVLLHGVENGFGLEAGCFKGCARDVAALRVLRYTD